MTSQITIHWGSGSPYAWRALLGLELKRAPYVSRLLEFSRGDTKSPEFRALNPRGKVPVLVDGDLVVRESLAILAYLDRRFPEPPLFGTSAAEAGVIWQDTLEVDTYLGAALRDAVAPLYGGKGDADTTAAALDKVHEELGRYDDRLRDRPWLAGDRVSALDITLYPAVRTLLRAASRPAAESLGLRIDLARTHPRVDAWRERLYALPGVPDTDPPHWR